MYFNVTLRLIFQNRVTYNPKAVAHVVSLKFQTNILNILYYLNWASYWENYVWLLHCNYL